MHASLTELLENLKPGLLWVSAAGVVRYANADAAARTGLGVGRKLGDPELARAVATAVSSQVPRTATLLGNPAQAGGAAPQLKCRIVPGLSADDAFVLIAPDASADHGTAFDNLLQVIRSDLHDPLLAANEALLLARNGATDAHGVDTLCDTVDEVLQTLRKLVDLADLWSSSALLDNERIEPWPLLKKVWAEVEPMAVARSIKVRFRAHGDADQLAPVYGSETWLARVFVECLESALRSARRGSALLIEHRQMGPRLMIVFRDCAVFAPLSPGAVEMSGRSAGKATAAPRLQAREQIGLKLCQHIVALHGGQLREEQDDGVRNFLIDLPTGAPHHAGDSPLDITQAQHYARDLAALMARARIAGVAAATPHLATTGRAN